MQVIKCGGNNENNLPFDQFKQLFILECQKEGQIVSLQFINGRVGLAEVVRR